MLIDGQFKMIYLHYVLQKRRCRNYLDFSDAYFDEDFYLPSKNVAQSNLGIIILSLKITLKKSELCNQLL